MGVGGADLAVRVLVALLGGFVVNAAVGLSVYLAWFELTGTNFKVGASELGVPAILFHLSYTGAGAVATAVVVAMVVAGRSSAALATTLVTLGVTGVSVVVYVALPDREPDELILVLIPLVAVSAALPLRGRSRRR